MELRAYLEKNGISQEAFGKSLEKPVSQGLVWQWLEGRTNITIDHAKQIVRATSGEVTAHDLMPETFPQGFVFPEEAAAA